MNLDNNNVSFATPVPEDNSRMLEEIENNSIELEARKIAALEEIAKNTSKIYELLKELLEHQR